MAMQRSIEIAISVFTDAETETPCMYDTVLHIKVPSVHSIGYLNKFVPFLSKIGALF